MLTSTPTKEKKKNPSPNKHNRSSTSGTLKVIINSCHRSNIHFDQMFQKNPNYELKKDELIQLLGRFEAELQAKEIAIATLKVISIECLTFSISFLFLLFPVREVEISHFDFKFRPI